MTIKSSNKTIAKNTFFLYVRMLFTMIVSLYTSRVILQKLGVDDYGIYQAVGGIVGFLSFINGALSTGSSRFLTYELGTGNQKKLEETFSTTLSIHIALALIIAVVAEIGGLWFLHNKMVIPAERIEAAYFVFQMSILTALCSIIIVPFNATIIAHEQMSIYAYISIVEVILKLLIVYLLTVFDIDRLKTYSFFLFVIHVVLLLFYITYCKLQFKEVKCNLHFEKNIFKEIASFSGWSLFSNATIALNSQGILIVLNLFFTPAIVTARSISVQVNMAANQFVNSFRTAVNPQIVKRYAANDVNGSQRLLLESTKYSYFLMLLLCVPLCLLAEPILNIWLETVPEYSVPFLQLIVIQSLCQVFDTSFYTALYTKGRLRENALISPAISLLRFPIVYLLFKMGYSPLVLSWASIITYAILGFIVKPWLIIKIANYKLNDILKIFLVCFKVTIVALPVPLLVNSFVEKSTVFGFLVLLGIIEISIIVAVYMVGLDKDMRHKLKTYLRQKL